MRFFKLPDLGEGLHEAEVVEWHVSEGDAVRTDQLLVSVETEKAVVDLPSPQDGTIVRRFGEVGEVIHVGEPLVEFAGEEDSGTVVGQLADAGAQTVTVDRFTIGARPAEAGEHAVRAAPAVRALARRLGIDLAGVAARGTGGTVTPEDVERAHRLGQAGEGFEPLRRARRTMARAMSRAHAEVVPVSIYEDADVEHWFGHTDTTIRIVRAVADACTAAPELNAWFDGTAIARRLHDQVDLGIAVNTEDGLFVPVLRDIARRDPEDLRAGLDRLRADVAARTIPVEEMQGATISLSNFGMHGGRYAAPVVVPPTVAIVGTGVVRAQPVAVAGEVVVHRVMPLSLTFDHRAATGVEAARFIAALCKNLEA